MTLVVEGGGPGVVTLSLFLGSDAFFKSGLLVALADGGFEVNRVVVDFLCYAPVVDYFPCSLDCSGFLALYVWFVVVSFC